MFPKTFTTHELSSTWYTDKSGLTTGFWRPISRAEHEHKDAAQGWAHSFFGQIEDTYVRRFTICQLFRNWNVDGLLLEHI